MSESFTRRRLLAASALAAGGLSFALDDAFAQELAPTPQCHDGDQPTARQSEGPFFRPSSPQRADLVEPASKARLVEVGGQVLTRGCRPIANALVDLWHADADGDYDNRGFRGRGHQFTDAQGRYRFVTIRPARYTGRTAHYHVKVQAANGPVLTTQLYFPGEPANRRDSLYRRELEMRFSGASDARFDFVLNRA